MSVYIKEDRKDEVFKNNYKNILSTLLVLTIFIISGAIFNVLGFGLFGLSRILIFKLGYFTYKKFSR